MCLDRVCLCGPYLYNLCIITMYLLCISLQTRYIVDTERDTERGKYKIPRGTLRVLRWRPTPTQTALVVLRPPCMPFCCSPPRPLSLRLPPLPRPSSLLRALKLQQPRQQHRSRQQPRQQRLCSQSVRLAWLSRSRRAKGRQHRFAITQRGSVWRWWVAAMISTISTISTAVDIHDIHYGLRVGALHPQFVQCIQCICVLIQCIYSVSASTSDTVDTYCTSRVMGIQPWARLSRNRLSGQESGAVSKRTHPALSA